MSGPIITGRADWTLKECSKVMKEHGVHHVPVADEHNTLAGLISATDIFTAVKESGWEEDVPAGESNTNRLGSARYL